MLSPPQMRCLRCLSPASTMGKINIVYCAGCDKSQEYCTCTPASHAARVFTFLRQERDFSFPLWAIRTHTGIEDDDIALCLGRLEALGLVQHDSGLWRVRRR